MRRILFLGIVLILAFGMAPICNGNGEEDYLDLIEKIRDPDYFGVTVYEATDNELWAFLSDEPNRIFIEGAIRQITFGYKVLEPSKAVSIPAEAQFLNFMGKKLTLGGLTLFLTQLETNYSSFGPLLAPTIGPLMTIAEGVMIFNKFVDVLKAKEETFLVDKYVDERKKGKNAEEAYNLTINSPDFEPIVNLILGLEEFRTFGKTRAELKKAFWDYCEYIYQSWDLANNREKRENIKRYILEWIRRSTSAPTPVLTSVPSPTPSPTLVSPSPSPTEMPEIKPTPAPIGEKIAYISREDFSPWVINPDGTGAERLILLEGGIIHQPNWSPDGEKLAFIIGGQIGLLGTDGPEETFLAILGSGSCPKYNDILEELQRYIGFSRIRFTSDSKGIIIGIFFLIAGAEETKPFLCHIPLDPSISPLPIIYLEKDFDINPIDSSFVFIEEERLCSKLYLADTDGQNHRKIGPTMGGKCLGEKVELPVLPMLPTWSPDGKKIAFYGLYAERGKAKIYVMEAQEKSSPQPIVEVNIPQLPFFPPGDSPLPAWLPGLSWSPDGSQIAYNHGEEIWLINSDGSGQPKRLVKGFHPAWGLVAVSQN